MQEYFRNRFKCYAEQNACAACSRFNSLPFFQIIDLSLLFKLGLFKLGLCNSSANTVDLPYILETGS